MQSKRIDYIDRAKGLLILFVVLHHLPQVLNHFAIQWYWKDLYSYIDLFYISFFMPAFFVVSGICSKSTAGGKQDISVKALIWKSFIALMVPALTITILFDIKEIAICFFHEKSIDVVKYIKEIVFFGGKFWFLSALFVAKSLFAIMAIIEIKKRIALEVIFAGVGLFFYQKDIVNVWYFEHAFCLLIFLELGLLLKTKISLRMEVVCTFVYFFVVLLYYSYSGHIPYITAKIICSYVELPVLLITASCGSIAILFLSKFMQFNFFEYLGKNSLIVYCFHVPIMFYVLPLIPSDTFHAPLWCGVVFFIIVCSTILISLVLAKIIKTKYLSFIIGQGFWKGTAMSKDVKFPK